MTIEQIRHLYHNEPFRPFDIHMANGRSLHVPHRELLLPPPSGRTIAVYQAEDDAIHIIDLLLVAEVQLQANGRE